MAGRFFDWSTVPRTSGLGSSGRPARAATSVPSGASRAGSSPVAAVTTSLVQSATARAFYECKICKCRGMSRTFCGICKNRNCMTEIPPDPVPGAVPGVPEVVRRGSLDRAIAEGRKIVRIKSGIPKLDRVLGGGYVDRTGILIAGDPGAGKSTLLLQACLSFVGPQKKRVVKGKNKKTGEKEYEYVDTGEIRRALYVSGEEAFDQVGARAARLPNALERGEYIEFLTTRSVPEAMGAILDVKPGLIVVDSLQEVGDEQLSGRFGGEYQMCNAVRSVMSSIRENGTGVALFVCHVRKDGDIAGAKKVEHLVDMSCKLSIELDEEEEDEDGNPIPLEDRQVSDERMLEAYKNRYGSITERSVFRMTAEGLR